MPRKPLSVDSSLRLGGIGNPRWMALLDALATSRSITGAARSAGLSYKAAWDALDAMNNLAGGAVVVTSVGGKGGGGARLTPHGRDLLATWRIAESENRKFIAAVNARLGHAPAGVRALGKLAVRTSARNQWSGTVARVQPGTVNDEVEVRLASGDTLVAVITHESRENLGLEPGRGVVALVKASSILVGQGAARLRLSARNQLKGRVARVVRGAVNSEVVIALRKGATVAAIITNESADTLRLKRGQAAWAIFKASSVILAAD